MNESIQKYRRRLILCSLIAVKITNKLTRCLLESLNGFVEISTWLWWLSVAFFGIGDLITTAVAVFHISIIEGSPFVSWLLHTYGMFGLLIMKILSLALGYIVWCSIPRPHNVGVPLAYSMLGVGLTTWNLFVIGFTLSG